MDLRGAALSTERPPVFHHSAAFVTRMVHLCEASAEQTRGQPQLGEGLPSFGLMLGISDRFIGASVHADKNQGETAAFAIGFHGHDMLIAFRTDF